MHVYCYCHTKSCTSIREDAVEQAILECLRPLVFSDEEKACLTNAAARLKAILLKERENQTSALSIWVTKISNCLERLTDAYLDQALDRDSANPSAIFFFLPI